jgi:hypothetical protein
MELNEKLQAEITGIFRNVQYGRITFYLSPERKTLNYSVETSGMLAIEGQCNATETPPQEKLQQKKFDKKTKKTLGKTCVKVYTKNIDS